MNLVQLDANQSKPVVAGSGRWRFGSTEVDEIANRLYIDEKPVAIDRSSYDLLLCLLHNVGNVVGKEQLLRIGWPGRVVSDNSLVKAIGRLRQALNDANGERLSVVPGYGYRLNGPVQQLSAVPEAALATTAPEAKSNNSSLAPMHRRRWLLVVLFGLLTLAMIGTARIGIGPSQPASAINPVATADIGSTTSLAILPFVDLSPNQDQTYFSDGLADQLLNDLSQLPQIHTVGRTSSFAYRGKTVDIQTIGRNLHAAAVLEGSVRRSGDRIRVSVQLVNTADGFDLWSQTYDQPITELFAMQDEIARAIVAALRIELLPEQGNGLAKHGTASPEAYLQLLLARHLFKDDETAERRSLVAYQRAIELDPKFVAAWYGMADILGHSGMYADSANEALTGKQHAMDAVNHVIALAPDWPDGYLLRGDLKYAHWWDWVGGEADLEHAAALSSHDNESYLIRLCRLRAAQGRLPEAIALARRATQINPASGAWQVMGYHYTALGEYNQARDALTQAIRVLPLDEHAHYYLGLVELLQGRPSAALPHFEDSAHFLRLTGLAIANHSLGDVAESERNLQLLITRFGDITPYQAAEVYAWRGENDAAFQWLDRALVLHDASFMYLKFDPLLRKLHADPRYRALLIKLQLPV